MDTTWDPEKALETNPSVTITDERSISLNYKLIKILLYISYFKKQFEFHTADKFWLNLVSKLYMYTLYGKIGWGNEC